MRAFHWEAGLRFVGDFVELLPAVAPAPTTLDEFRHQADLLLRSLPSNRSLLVRSRQVGSQGMAELRTIGVGLLVLEK